MKYLNKLLLSIIIVTMGLAAACAPAPPETTKAPVENSRDIDVTDAGRDTFNVSC
jgi:hypothetical protein